MVDHKEAYEQLERRRHILTEDKHYPIFRLSRWEYDELSDRHFPPAWREGFGIPFKFSSIQEITYVLKHIDYCDFDTTVFAKFDMGAQIASSFMISSDLELKWLGYSDLWVMDRLHYYTDFKLRNRLSPINFKEDFRVTIRNRNKYW